MAENLPNDHYDFEEQYRLIREALEPQLKALIDAKIDEDEARQIIENRVRYLIEHPEETT